MEVTCVGLLVLLHSRIFLVSMYNYEARFSLFIIKTVGLYRVPRQSYSQNSHGSYILKPIIVQLILPGYANYPLIDLCTINNVKPVPVEWQQEQGMISRRK